MRDLLSDEYDSVAGDSASRLVPSSLRRVGGAVLFLGVIAAMGLWSYRLGTRDANEVPVIKAMAGPARVAPDDPGGVTAAHQGLEVNSVLAGRAPVPARNGNAVPEPNALADEDRPEDELVVAGTPLTATSSADETPEPMPSPEPSPAAEPEAKSPSLQTELAAMIASVAPSSAETTDDAMPEAAAGARPKGRPANLSIARAPVAEAVPARAVAAEVAAVTPTQAAAPREVTRVDPGARMVQLGAYDSEAQAREAWGRLVRRDGDLLRTKSLYVERATSNARVFYRLRVAGFDGADETRRMCESLRGRGVDCIPVTLR